MPAYLEQLTIRVAEGLGQLTDAERSLQTRYFLAAQKSDGGFGGREGGSDLYYTGFALRGLAVLGELYGPVAERAAAFLQSKLGGQESIVDFFSLIYGGMLIKSAAGIDVFANSQPGWQDQVATWLETLRRADGGYAKGIEGQASSTYHSFLVVICLQLLDRLPPEPARLLTFLRSQAAEEGGFREIKAGKRAGTNPTAAAIATFKILDALDENTRLDTIDFLLDMQTDEGGLRANTRIPIADLLSTFTGLTTLEDLGGLAEIDLAAAERFVQSLQREEGGFHAAAWDGAHDVEYSFYGLASLSFFARRRMMK
ncbi:Prenyltransferase and squalene oxidase repeat protein [Anatilimnocola aggregata]|uniref:Geranylgeranyl transferase type II subunit beta n=1 Tax=Anatilimnocola aggregata TaxID=2528021 RepID=A0A517Y6D9_9BACT|nr:prenyltransferase/squalene oxidase repeat-containing protein [Anatilimnocola aggregata]QDU25797.1 Prenyltransferase and squalene oxidase repeat protein [Anatilimnocola aggregata]